MMAIRVRLSFMMFVQYFIYGAWLVTLRNSGQGECGYDVFRTDPLSRVAGSVDELDIMMEIPKFAQDESRIVGGFGSRWLGGSRG